MIAIRQPIRFISSARRRIPDARIASKSVSRALKDRSTSETLLDKRVVNNYDPLKKFEPFPFAVTEANKGEMVKRVIMPLHDLPYEEQLTIKERYCRDALRHFGQELYKSGTPVRLNVNRLPCHINPIVPARNTNGYRNKDELSIWHGHDGQITAGYMIFPVSKHGDTVCVEPNACSIIKEESIQLSDLLQEFLRTRAKLPVSYSLGSDGGWRRFVIRSNANKELMLIGVINPRGLKVREVLDERDNFRDFIMARIQDTDLKLVSLYYQPCPHNKCRHQDVPYELLHGKPVIKEKIGKYEYMISPESFLPHNTEGAQALYSAIRSDLKDCFNYTDSVAPSQSNNRTKPFIIDGHCGIGMLALNLHDLASKVVGIDSSGQAVDDATNNAKLNGIENCEFICSNLEIVLERVLEKYSKHCDDVLFICDVGRVALHKHVIETIRNCKSINKLVFVTPKVDAPRIMNNLHDLCSKRGPRSLPPFAPILATPVDVYPQVEAFQTVFILERLPQ